MNRLTYKSPAQVPQAGQKKLEVIQIQGVSSVPSSIVFNMININNQNTNATIGIGENAQSSWDSHSKNNYGTGQWIGNSVSANIVNFIYDNDFIDSPINDQDFKPAVNNQA
ncbi:hypothetical protein GC102_18690 [Paenibacillus sp. LMG 31460]|uniref:Spore germination protein gerPA/gerPF n=2 Tax=Paenibacillus TaxID=44249 RepID=A0ABX1Z755_9BACL|nr:hypothetical protein [Paenibacillus germinis]